MHETANDSGGGVNRVTPERVVSQPTTAQNHKLVTAHRAKNACDHEGLNGMRGGESSVFAPFTRWLAQSCLYIDDAAL